MFHDWDRVTSVFIHIFPLMGPYLPPAPLPALTLGSDDLSPLVSHYLRRLPRRGVHYHLEDFIPVAAHLLLVLAGTDRANSQNGENLKVFFFLQLAYLFKTEVMDRKKMASDQELVTSLRWMTERHPHPIYKVPNGSPSSGTRMLTVLQAARKKGYKGSAVSVLIGTLG